MKSELALTRRRRLILATVVMCAVLIAGLGILWQGGKVSEAALLNAHPGLIGWWRFDEGTGIVAGDSSGNGNSGTITGASWVTGKYGTALSFSGSSNSHVQVPDASILEVTGDLTLSAWIYPTATNRMLIVGKYWNNEFDLLIQSNGALEIAFGNPYRDLQSTGTISLNAWTYICVVRKVATNEIDFYINGQLDSNKTYSTTTISASNRPVQLGKDNNNANFYSGWVDEVQIYNRALSATEIQAYYQQNPDFSSNLLAKVPKGTTDFIATLSWQGTGGINVTVQSPSQNYTENMMPVYQKTTYSTSGGTSTMLNIKRLEVSIGALASDQNWYIILVTSNVQDYKITVEVQK